MKSANIRYLPGLDHLRAFAALLIVFYHALAVLSLIPRNAPRVTKSFWILPRNPFNALLQEGHTAVALFMVLSGFVFTIGCVGREIQYWPFLKNRFLRIYPLFVVLFLVGAAAAPNSYSWTSAMQSLLFQANLNGAVTLDPFTGMFWAVAVEFQFYLAFPFLHRFIERDGFKWAFALLTLTLALRFVAAKCGTSNARDISYWHIIGRIDQFVIGMLAARAYLRIQHRDVRWAALALASFALVLAVITGYSVLGAWDSVEMWKIGWPPVEGLAWACFIVTYIGFSQRHAGRWSWPLEQVGTWSYSIYLLHSPILVLMPRLIPMPDSRTPNQMSQLYALKYILPVVLPLAALSYYVIERPFLQMRVKYLRERSP